MIIKAAPHNHAGNLSRYLLNPKEDEKEFLMDLRDSATDDLPKSLTDWEIIARCNSRAEKVLYHAHIRLREGESLKEAQWFELIQELEEKLGFANCPRAVVGHNNEKTGLHVHIVWSRLDSETGKMVSLSHDRKVHHSVAREAEKRYGLEPVISKPVREKKRLSDRQIRALKDRQIDKEKLVRNVQSAWDVCDSGEEMKAMLAALGVNLVPGDRRDWVVERNGLKLNPVRLLDGVTTAEFREKLKDLDLEKERQKERETSPATPLFGRKARLQLQKQVDKHLANDEKGQPAKTGFRKKRVKAPAPRLRRKMWYGDPGI